MQSEAQRSDERLPDWGFRWRTESRSTDGSILGERNGDAARKQGSELGLDCGGPPSRLVFDKEIGGFMIEQFWHLKNVALFEHLSPADIQLLESNSRIRQLRRGETVYAPSDSAEGVLLLVSGRIKISQRNADGKQTILTLIEPGELFGELAILDGQVRGEYAEAVMNSQVVFIPKPLLLTLMGRYPEVSVGISKIIGFRRQRIERRMRNLLFQSNRKRLIHLLLELVERYGQPTDGGVRLNIKLTHLEMANVIGSTRETVTVVLGQLQHEGLIRVVRRQLTITNLAALATEVDEQLPKLRAGCAGHQGCRSLKSLRIHGGRSDRGRGGSSVRQPTVGFVARPAAERLAFNQIVSRGGVVYGREFVDSRLPRVLSPPFRVRVLESLPPQYDCGAR